MTTTRYFVMNEHTLGYVLAAAPKWFCVLHGSVLRGSLHDWRDGPVFLDGSDALRPATRADFAAYFVVPPPHFAEVTNGT